MARKSLGHVELEWQCPKCGVRNPGRNTVCNGCGAPQPEHVEFDAPASGQLIEDEETLARATAGPDIHCPYCNARTQADATQCHQCGGDLTAAAVRRHGQVLGALNTAPDAKITCRICNTENPAAAFTCGACGAPLRAAEPEPAPTPSPAMENKRGCGWLGIGAVVIGLLLIIGGILFFFTGTADSLEGTVSEARWSRTIAVEEIGPVTYEGWQTELPAGATVLACRQEVRETVSEPVENAREVCGTPYVIDEGTGFGEAVQDCEYEVLADFCSYEVMEWRRVEDAIESGNGQQRQWPAVLVSETRREGARSETLQCVFRAGENTYIYGMNTEERFAGCLPGSVWELEINRAGGVTRATPR